MNILRRLILLFLVLINTIATNAQQPPVEMADSMRSNGRIYVVVAVVITILLGLLFFVIRIDRKLSRLEKNSD
jgi:CcmD family protein